jgi:tetratricopeptide (TPR) repeat protein
MVAFDLNRFEDARRSYLAILNSSVNENVTALAQPFSNYQKNAAEMLYEIEFAVGNYEQAKAYLDQSIEYVFQHFCGNAYEQKAFWQAVQYSKIESAREHYKEAASYIIPYLFERQLWREQELAQSFLDLLLRLRTRSDLVEAFGEAIKNFYTRRSDSGWVSYYIPFLGGEIPIDIYEPDNKDEELSLVRKFVENQWMYYVIQAEK